MARSRKKSPFHGHTTAVSEKEFKRKENRRARKATNDALKQLKEPPPERAFKSAWGPKDGKAYYSDKKAMRK